MIEYKNKYLKYKNKYLELKNKQIGGVITTEIVDHELIIYGLKRDIKVSLDSTRPSKLNMEDIIELKIKIDGVSDIDELNGYVFVSKSIGGYFELYIKSDLISADSKEEETERYEIGAGYRVSVYTKKDNQIHVFKEYQIEELEDLTNTQIEIQSHIQETIKDELTRFTNVKIPKLLYFDKETRTIIFDRVYNPFDTDINNPSPMLHFKLTNDLSKKSYVAGRGSIILLPEVSTLLGTYQIDLLGCMSELGELCALLNFKCELILRDIEIVIGKDRIDNKLKLYLLDFDRVHLCEGHINKYRPGLLRLIEDEYFQWKSDQSSSPFIRAFTESYMRIAIEHNSKEHADKIIEKLSSS
jgi:hypothetical protein|uniref:Uncharacterized protein n=1 Tax=viral metagenome TaxID=1070528 RepID=A0A6C0IVA0_9ZZZZ